MLKSDNEMRKLGTDRERRRRRSEVLYELDMLLEPPVTERDLFRPSPCAPRYIWQKQWGPGC